MSDYEHIKTTVVIIIFSICYLISIVRRTAKNQMDLYDLMMLSTVAIIPSLFVLFPHLTEKITRSMGIGFPFLLLFGSLIAVLFIFIHRLTEKIYKIESDNRLLIQELSLLKGDHRKYETNSKK